MKRLISILIFGIIGLLISGCSSVETTKPLPDKKGKILRELPTFLNNTFIINNEEENQLLGKDNLEFEFINDHNCLVKSFKTFTKEEVDQHEYYNLTGAFLLFKNDTLVEELTKLKKLDKSYLTYSQKTKLETLTKADEKGELAWIKPVIFKEGLYQYDHKLIYNINLENNILTSYNNSGKDKDLKILFKKFKDYYILNIIGEKNWFHVFIKFKDELLTFEAINPSTLKDNQAYYKSFLEFNSIEDYTVTVTIQDKNLLDLLKNEDAFLEELSSYTKVNKTTNDFPYGRMLLIVIIVIALGIFAYRKFK